MAKASGHAAHGRKPPQGHPADNPKKASDATAPNSNQIKDPDDWVTGEEPMTGAQASYLKTLSEEAHAPDAFDPELDKADASKRIDALKHKVGR